MKRTLVAAAVFLFASVAMAQTAAPPPQGGTIESVIVTAPKQRPENALDDFIITHC